MYTTIQRIIIPKAIQTTRKNPGNFTVTRLIKSLVALLATLQIAAIAHAESAVRPSPSGHFVSYNGKTMTLIGDSGTQCVMQNTNIDYAKWIDDCANAGLNVIHIWSFVAPRQQLDGTDLEDRYGYLYPSVMPWPRKADGPKAYDGGNQWDLKQWDPAYWIRLRSLCKVARDRGLIVGITVFFGWPKHPPDWNYHPFNVRNGGPVEDNGRMATRVQQIATPGTEVLDQPWSDAWSPEKKNQYLWEKFCQKLIEETNEFDNIFFVFMDEHSYDEGNGGDHFLQFFKKRGACWVDWDDRQNAVDMVFEQVPYDNTSGMNVGAMKGFGKSPARPILLLENPPYQGTPVRLALWSMLCGGGHYIFHNDAEQETVFTGIMGYDPNVPGGDTAQVKREWLGHAARLFNTRVKNLDQFTPQNARVNTGNFCIGAPHTEYIVYAPANGPNEITVDLTGSNQEFHCQFLNPRNGTWLKEETRKGNRIEIFTRPDKEDWTLYLTTKN